MRICSLLPSATEIVAELGLVGSLVGISEECDWPPEVRSLPIVTASRVDTTRLTSFEIDKAVREAVGDGRPLYAIDRDLLEALQPDLILTQNLCAVCAVSAENVTELCATRRLPSGTSPGGRRSTSAFADLECDGRGAGGGDASFWECGAAQPPHFRTEGDDR
jgi:iron complex transport system substrate-binding protein